MGKVWKDVVEYEGLYEISEDKVVRNKKTLYILTQYIPKNGTSFYVALTKNSRTIATRVDTIYHKAYGTLVDNLDGEIWVNVKEYENIYQVSNCGRVRSLDRFIEQTHSKNGLYKRYVEGRILSLDRTNGNGYHIVQFSNGYDDQPKKNEYIHILVAKHFIPNTDNKPTVNHKDGNKSNNHVDNLEWATQQEQCIHALENNLGNILEKRKLSALRGEKNHRTSLSDKDALEIYDLAKSGILPMPKIGKIYNTSKHVVKSIKYKTSWLHIHEIA